MHAASTSCVGLGLVPGPCHERNEFPVARFSAVSPGQAALARPPLPRIRRAPSPFRARGTLWRNVPPRVRSWDPAPWVRFHQKLASHSPPLSECLVPTATTPFQDDAARLRTDVASDNRALDLQQEEESPSPLTQRLVVGWPPGDDQVGSLVEVFICSLFLLCLPSALWRWERRHQASTSQPSRHHRV